MDDISGTIRGYRIFTACRTVNGKVFRPEDHLDRLYSSAASIYMQPPMPRDGLRLLLNEVVQKNIESGARGDLLIDVFFSGGLDGSSMRQSGKGAHLYMAVQELIPPTNEQYENGVRLATFCHQRMCPEVKLLNYIGAVVAHQTVIPRYNAFDVLFTSPPDGKEALEGSTFTVFFVKESGVLVTPPLDGRILDSVTRRALLQILAGRNDELRVFEQPILTSDLPKCREGFLVSTTRNVLPITGINDWSLGDGKPGPVTLKAKAALEEYIRAY